MNRSCWFLIFLLFSGAWQSPLCRADTFPAQRKIDKEPAYQTKTPHYALLVFGKEGKDQVWTVHDGDLLYVDRNGNGDLTEPGERIERLKPRKGFEAVPSRTFEVGELKLGGLTHHGLQVKTIPLKEYAAGYLSRRPEFKEEIKKDPEAIVCSIDCEVEVPGIKGGGLNGGFGVLAGPTDAQGFLILGRNASSAPIVRLGGPIQIDFPDVKPKLRPGFAVELTLSVGFAGIGSGTFALIGYHETVPAEAKPTVEIEIASATQGTSPYREKYELPIRCCGTNLYGPVRVDPKQPSGDAMVTLSFPAWKEGQVNSTRHSLEIVKGVARHASLPVSGELTWTIRHPDREANIPHLKYSGDGKRLFLSGYPSGITQFWDLENRKEIRRFESAKGLRGSSDYAQLTPDWKSLLIAEETRKATRIENEGKNDSLFERGGTVQVWDPETGEQKSFLYPESGSGPGYFQLSPDGKKLVLVEMKSLRTSEREKTSHAQTSLWDLQTQERRLLGDSFLTPIFSSDSKFGLISVANQEKKASIIKKIDLDSGKTLAEFDCSELGQTIRLLGISQDNRWVAAQLGTGIESPPIILFLDAATLKEKGRLVLETAAPKIYGWHTYSFSPDGKIFETADWKGNIHLWSLEEKKVIRVIPLEYGSWVRQFSPDGRFLAIAWLPKYDRSFDETRDADPLDMPQPRISLIDLKESTRPPIVLIAPHGYCGSLAFRPDGKQLAFGSLGGVHIFDIDKLITKKEKP